MKTKTQHAKFSDWQTSAEKHAISVGCPDDLWAEDDPYDLLEAARVAYAEGRSAVDFINEIFADDIASRKHDELMVAEAEEYAELDHEIEEEE